MMEQPEATPDQATLRQNQSDLVIALPHLRAVASKMTELPVSFEIVDKHDDLGLALVRLPGLASQVASLRQNEDLKKDMRRARKVSRATSAPSDLDLLMFKIRSEFADAYHGWTPTMGKNRYVHVHPWGPEILPGSAGSWVPADASAVKISRPAPGPGRPVRVGILDTALFAHPSLNGAFVASTGTMLQTAPSYPQFAGHATFVAGIILQRAPAADLDVRRNIGDQGFATVWDTARAMMTFADSGVDILNVSWGCRVEDGQPPLVLDRAVELLGREMVIVAAAGNHLHRPDEPGFVPPTTPTYPAALSDVVSVAATNPDGSPATINPQGPWIDLLARGIDVTSTYLTGDVILNTDQGDLTVRFDGYARGRGTSFAAANVVGELAARAAKEHRSAREVLHDMLTQLPDRPAFQARPYFDGD
jgi:membrane-anchored mycosin MYCP